MQIIIYILWGKSRVTALHQIILQQIIHCGYNPKQQQNRDKNRDGENDNIPGEIKVAEPDHDVGEHNIDGYKLQNKDILPSLPFTADRACICI